MAATNKLTDTTIRGAKRRAKPYKLFDGDGLYVLVRTDGKKYWRLKYYVLSVEKLISLGVYPTVTPTPWRAPQSMVESDRPPPKGSLLGETNYWSRQMANGWNSARRAAQGKAISNVAALANSTGPRTAEEQARSSRNAAFREGRRETMRAYIARLSGLLRQQKRDRRINVDVTRPQR